MGRYVFLRRASRVDLATAARLLEAAGARILDEVDGRALLVEADATAVDRVGRRLEGWVVSPERSFPRPGPRRQDPPAPGP